MGNMTQPRNTIYAAPLSAHLKALRKLLVSCCIAFGVAFVLIFYFLCDVLIGFVTEPIVARGVEIIYTAVSEAIVTQFKICSVAAVIVASPFIFWQLWIFIKPALYAHEQKTFKWLFLSGLVLFMVGVVFCYYAVYFLAIDFFLIAGENMATPMLSIDKYVGFLFSFLLPFGVVFLLPVAMYIMTRLGIMSYDKIKDKRKYVILGIAVAAAILTPPDVISQCLLGIPMLLLFELGMQISRLTQKRQESVERAIT